MALVGDQVLSAKHTNYRGTTNSLIKTHPLEARTLIDYLAKRNKAPNQYRKLADLTRNHAPFLYRMNLMKKLTVHDGCVNTICWNKTGEYILSGSDDDNLCITKPTYLFDDSKDYTVLHKIPTQHHGNIFSSQFLPNTNDYWLVSCSSGGPVIVHDINAENPSIGVLNFNCHTSTIFNVVTLQDDDKVFLSCGEDKTVRLFDIRCHRSCARASTCPHPALIRNSYAITTLSVHPLNSNLLLVGRADGMALVYDRRKLPDPSKFSREQAHLNYLANAESGKKQETAKYLHPLEGVVSQFTVPDMTERCRFTSLCYSNDGSQVLACYSQDYIYLFNHDKSSNFDLIQTLPRNGVPIIDEPNNDNTSEKANNQTDRSQHRPYRQTPRIRVRGDWSDTGINSVPRSENTTSRTGTSILQRMTEVAFSRNQGPRLINRPIELLAGPLFFSSNNEGQTNRSDADQVRNQDDHGDEEQDEDGSNEDEGRGDEEVITGTIELSVQCDDDPVEDTGDIGEDANSESKINGDTGKPKISDKTKDKFKKTFAGLRDRFNNIPTYHPRVKYQGHRNSRTSIKQAIFWGDDYIMSGSDCGRIMIWEKNTAKLVMGFPADERVVNCLAPNPHYYALASSGIDYDIKLWSTQNLVDCPLKVSQEEMDKIVKNNELMLEEARQTITVPPHLFFRVLASFAQNRLS